MDDYVQSKQKLFSNQTADDVAIFNADCTISHGLISTVNAQVYQFSRLNAVERGADIRSGKICYHEGNGEDEVIVPVDKIALPGTHNLENALAAVTIAKYCGCKTEAIRKTLQSFQGVAHRTEFVCEHDGIRYYNDSKATNPIAMTRALEAFSEPIVLIAGGLDRGIDFRELVPIFSERLFGLVVYGQTASILQQRGTEAHVPVVERTNTLHDAVNIAHRVARIGDIVILSPGCASWDQFTSFEERGDMFKEAVHML